VLPITVIIARNSNPSRQAYTPPKLPKTSNSAQPSLALPALGLVGSGFTLRLAEEPEAAPPLG